MVDEVVAGEGVDPVGVAGDVGDGDRDDLAVARCRRQPRRRGGADRPERARTVRRQPISVTSSLVLGPLDDLGDGGVVAHRPAGGSRSRRRRAWVQCRRSP